MSRQIKTNLNLVVRHQFGEILILKREDTVLSFIVLLPNKI